MKASRESWIPALGRWRSVPAYVRMVRWFSLEDLPRLIAGDLGLRPGMRALDIGCGPGALVKEALRLQPAARVIGLDPDQEMLRHGRSQADGAHWASAFAQALPFSDSTLDRITMTLMLHHLTRLQKQRALAEAVRVLRPGGRLFVTDWTAPKGAAAAGFLIVRAVDGFEQTADHAHGRLQDLLTDNGLQDLKELRRRDLWLGTITHFVATKPETGALGNFRGEATQ